MLILHRAFALCAYIFLFITFTIGWRNADQWLCVLLIHETNFLNMQHKFNVTLGVYYPSLFLLETIGNGVITNMDKWSKLQKSTFLHEYVHFLQDITTVVGLHNIFTHGEVIRYITELKNKSVNNEMHVPIDPLKANKNVGQNWKASTETLGDPNTDVVKVNSYNIVQGCVLTDCNSGKQTAVGSVELACEDKFGVSTTIHLGSAHMMECMAKAIEESIYPTTTRQSPYNPYYIAEDVAELIMPGISSDKFTMIALYDRALQSSNPGLAFVRYLEDKVSQGINYTMIDSSMIYQELKNASTSNASLGIIPFEESFKQLANLALGVLKEFTAGIWFFKNIDNWSESTILNGARLRLEFPELFIELAKGGDICKNKTFQSLLSVFGTPLVLNEARKCTFRRPAGVKVTKGEIVDVFTMMHMVYVFLYSDGEYPCPLIWYCRKNSCFLNRFRIDNRCEHKPWQKTRRFGNCKFCQWWRFKGFKNVKLVNP